jgi:DNA-binding transcriptional LysR family regulator
LQQARIILEANDQLLRLGGNNIGPVPLRLGLSTVFVDDFVKHQTPETLADIFIQSDDSTSIGRGLVEGYIDIACIYHNQRLAPEIDQMIVNERAEPLVWVRAENFALSPGTPLPILTYPGDDWMIPTLTRLGLAYKIVFSSLDYHARIGAVEAGIGITSVPAGKVPPTLVRAEESYLPALPSVKALLCARLALETPKASEVMRSLSTLFFNSGLVSD